MAIENNDEVTLVFRVEREYRLDCTVAELAERIDVPLSKLKQYIDNDSTFSTVMDGVPDEAFHELEGEADEEVVDLEFIDIEVG